MREFQALEFAVPIPAPPDVVGYAFHSSQGWRDWLCDAARFTPQPGSSYQLAWEGGWYAAGNVKSYVRGQQVKLDWHGKGDPEATRVTIRLQPSPDGTQLELSHEGFGHGAPWNAVLEEAKQGWETGLENLQSIFRTGEDLRVTRRPMLGILLSDFDEKIAQDFGIPVTEGIRIDRPLEGMGAEQAGLQPNDVIVRMGETDIRTFQDIASALRGKRAGEAIPVDFYRGQERYSSSMELSRRPIAQVPMDPSQLAAELRPQYDQIRMELEQAFKGISEKQASFKPMADEWSARETLAHLILSETTLRFWITDLLRDEERTFEGDGGNLQADIDALLEVTPTVPGLLSRFAQAQAETLALITRADALKQRKGVLWRLGQNLLQFPGAHERSHIRQILASIQAAPN